MRIKLSTSRWGQAIRKRPRTAVVVCLPVVLALIGLMLWRARDWHKHVPASLTPPETVVVPASIASIRPTRAVTFAEGCATAECHTAMSGAPVAHTKCDSCHAPDTGGHVYPITRARENLCRECHDVGASSKFQHRAMAEDGCLTCHGPHVNGHPSQLKAKTVGGSCATCHQPEQGTLAHQPYAAGHCDSCHDPHSSDQPMLLRAGSGAGGSAGVCRDCHPAAAESVAAHGGLHDDIKGSCLACHGAHTANWKGLLIAEPREVCITCHRDIGKMVTGAVVSHDAVLTKQECISCHDPHSSVNAVMLRGDQTDVCLSCHSKPVAIAGGRTIPDMAATIRSSPFMHGPVASGHCSSCHSVHGGSHARLLKQMNPKVLTGGFDLRNYALCFSCHDKNLALDDSAWATQFRNGVTNLHRVHLQGGERSRGCGNCHMVHASSGPRLIAETVPYEGSDWKMPMGFTQTADGGSCSPGCHEPLRYSRGAGGVPAKAPKGGAP